MSFLAKLVMGNIEYNVLHVDFEISQPMDRTHRPSSRPRGGLIQVEVESGTTFDLFNWMVRPTMRRNGEVIFYRRDTNTPMRKLEFTDGFCVYFKETFSADGTRPMTTKITISARELTMQGSSIANDWPGMHSGSSESTGGHEMDSVQTFDAYGEQ